MFDGPYLRHPLEIEWEEEARTLYRARYDELRGVFEPRLQRGFDITRTPTVPNMREYLLRIVIDNLRLVPSHREMMAVLGGRELPCYWSLDQARLWEHAGEVVLVYSALYRDGLYTLAGRQSFVGAAARLRDYLGSFSDDPRLLLNEELSDRFDRFVSVLKSSRLTMTELEMLADDSDIGFL